jgi:peptidoglycan/LPS O-acetylase OafA/YrhL
MFAASLLLIPNGVMKERSQNLFSLNAPAWSLFWEYVANVVFGIVLYRIKRGLLVVLTIAAAVLLLAATVRTSNLLEDSLWIAVVVGGVLSTARLLQTLSPSRLRLVATPDIRSGPHSRALPAQQESERRRAG